MCRGVSHAITLLLPVKFPVSHSRVHSALIRELAEYGMTRVLILVLVTVLVILIQSRIMVMLTAASKGLSAS